MFVGRHLIVDINVNTLTNLTEIQPIYDVLERLSVQLDMTLAYPPIVAKFPWASSELEKFTKNLVDEDIKSPTILTMQQLLEMRKSHMAGISGTAVWLESHAAIHTWPEKFFISFDAYSCKEFNIYPALTLLEETFTIVSYSALNITRFTNRQQKVQLLTK